jgi:hypothetical protein
MDVHPTKNVSIGIDPYPNMAGESPVLRKIIYKWEILPVAMFAYQRVYGYDWIWLLNQILFKNPMRI